ncbi:lysophospholipid transporter LplT [Comamonas composti]|uniref:lysophospholipid transporter LplT n=1 Tax=Comamonas composti TaxID=408558 RepID=UPI0004025331|nr:lysophospholipid transporter LplT [Comamonas composti]
MKRGFYTIMSAQFFSSLADNALFVTAVELLRTQGGPEWQRAALVPMFALFYVILAPFVGAFADALPKGRVMLISNAIKIVGCLMMLLGGHPLLAYAVAGLGAAAYSPAKYGILTELLPASQLVKANGWVEGLTITSIILGVVVGGLLLRPDVSSWVLDSLPWSYIGVHSAAEVAITILVLIYALAAWFNLHIPLTGVAMRPLRQDPGRSLASNILSLLPDFWVCSQRLWADKLGQISLSTTTLFWGASGNLRYIVLAWGAAALSYDTSQASSLVGVVAIGTAAGAILASMRMRLDNATRVIPLGVAMGLLLICMNAVSDVRLAIPLLIVLGGIGGFMVVPMNALLQHRGHNLMGAGRSIAVQNFNEQACILALGALYALSTKFGLSAFGAITVFGLSVAAIMVCIGLWHRHNCRHHPQEVARLLSIARGN